MSTQPESLVRIVEHSVKTYAERPVFGERVDDTWSWMTYEELGIHVDELRGGLATLGVAAGDRVAIISRNSSAWAVAAYATYGLGATFIPMYEAQRHDDWQFILRDCNASVVLVRTAEIAAAIETMRDALPALRHVITIEGPADDPQSYLGLRRIGRERPTPVVYPDPESIAGFIYTSGTTGRPKGVMLSHANITSNILAGTSVFPLAADDRSVSFLPWAHVYGQVIELHVLISVGASTAFNQDVTKLVYDLAAIQPTMLVAVPRIFNRIHAGVLAQIEAKPRVIQALFHTGLAASLAQRRGQPLSPRDRIVLWLADHLVFAKIRRKFGGRLRYAISASATLAKEVGEFVDALGIEVYEGYGLTETSPVVSTNRPGKRKMGSVGLPIPGVTVRIDDRHSDTPGEGEIVVYGPNVMKGYHARPEENARAFSDDGGLRTGDLGHLDPDGYLFITGRIKEQYKLETGKYVMPTPLEEQLALSPYISNVMLYGADKPYNVALIVIDRGRLQAWAAEQGIALDDDLTKDRSVRELIARELETHGAALRSYERPRRFVLTTEDFTIENDLLTPTLKVKRRNVVARHGAALDALYVEPESPAPPPPKPRPGADEPARRART
jgi:long-chain acyl-CoA synthetase